jgi:hypothetical protein
MDHPRLATDAFNHSPAPEKKITLDRTALNRALFMGSHYFTNPNGDSFFGSNTTSVSLKNAGASSIIIECVTASRGFAERIVMAFKKGDKNPNHLTFSGCTREHHGIENRVEGADRVAELLTCLYRQVRQEADPKWRAALDISLSDSLSGGACVSMIPAASLAQKTGRLPIIKADSDDHISYTPPKIGPDKVCNSDCGKCQAKISLP